MLVGVLEEEQCWREIKRRQKHLKESRDRSPISTSAQSEQALDAYERALRTEAKPRSLPSAAGGQNAKEFWRTLARQHCDIGRWGHDGWDELQKEGPIPFQRTESNDDSSPPPSPPPLPPPSPPPSPASSSSTSGSSIGTDDEVEWQELKVSKQ
ncbi:hypothetical protein EWB00_001529 [Schistosoma japonicum]|uniref:Uncharacterized protein n=1 Tax=Schistosoma japonicum TaxID=6182 RepID=A0A4Z2DFD0_SCHJA|nr:hypothetical protein EWB00_001529 [Schistosoma japonicum]